MPSPTTRSSFFLPLVAFILTGCLVGGRGAAGGNGTISVGQTVNGRLEEADTTLGDDSKADLFTFAGKRGDVVTVTMRSPDFDTYLWVGSRTADGWSRIATDDDGAGGTDSKIVIALPADGTYLIRANALLADARGAYSLTLERGGTPTNTSRSSGRISSGQTINGRLEDGDQTISDGTKADDYTYTARAGERVTITMRSSAFDAYLTVGQLNGATFTPIDSDDDSAGGTDSQLVITFPTAGDYVIRANSISANERGTYTLSVASGAGGK